MKKLLFLLILFGFQWSTASAMTERFLSAETSGFMSQLIAGHQNIILGEVKSKHTRFFMPKESSSGTEKPYIGTILTVQVAEQMKGSVPGKSIQIILPGGCHKTLNICMKSKAFPKIEVGSNHLFFLAPTTTPGHYTLKNWRNGNQPVEEGFLTKWGLSLSKWKTNNQAQLKRLEEI